MRSWVWVLVAKCVALFRRRRDDEALEEEIALHLRLLEERFRSRGLSPVAAKQEARRVFGGVQQLREAHLDARAVPWLAEAAQDAAYTLRMLRRQPAFAVTAVLTLALGIGANTAVFSVLHAVILRPLPYPAADRIERVGWQWNGRNPATAALAPFKFAYLHEHSRVFESLATWQFTPVESTGDGPFNVLRVSADFLDVVGTSPAIGRAFRPDEHEAASAAVLLTDRCWRARFAADRAVLGRTIVVEDRSATVVGVLPSTFEFPELSEPIDFLVPLVLRPDPSDLGANFPVMGRLRPGLSRAAAEEDVMRVFAQLRGEHPKQFSSPERPVLMRFEDIHLADVTRPLWTLFAGVVVVLVIACTNVANLLLARGTTRLREMAVRGALGASRGRLLRQGIAEGLVIATIGGVVGVVLGVIGLRSLIGLAPSGIARFDQVGVDGVVLGFTVAVVMMSGALFGLAATGIGTWPRARAATSWTTRGDTATRTGRRIRQLMIALESALAMVLVVGAVLLVSGFYRLTQTPLGFNPNDVVAVTFRRLPSEFRAPARAAATARTLHDALAAIPGVEAVARTSVAPLGERGFNMPMTIDGRPDATEGAVEWRVVSPEYASVMRLHLKQGRWINAEDVTSDRPVVVVTANFAARYFPDGQTLGERVWIGVFRGERRPGATNIPREIIGVVDDIRDLGPTRSVRRTAFLPHTGDGGLPAFLVRTAGEVSVDSLRAAVRSADALLPEPIVSTMEARLGSRLARDRFSSLLMTAFASVALILTVVGVYGVVSWVVRQTTHELAIRIALGASRRRVLGGVLIQGLQPVIAGLAAGGAAALLASGLFAGLVVGVATVSVRVTAAAAALLFAAAIIAVWIPARRALAVDPAAALRAD